MSQENQEQSTNSNWHLRKEVTYGNMLSSLAILCSMFLAWGSVQAEFATFRSHMDAPAHEMADTRLDALEARIASMTVYDEAMTARLTAMHKEIIDRLDRIENRLDP